MNFQESWRGKEGSESFNAKMQDRQQIFSILISKDHILVQSGLLH